MTRTYHVSSAGGKVRRLDNLTGPWVTVDLAPSIPGATKIILLDVETDPNNSDRVIAVGYGSSANANYGIYVSGDAGVTWIQPGGNYQTNTDINGVSIWYEVSVVDSNTVFVSGRNGYVAKSTDGGLTFNLTTQLPSLPNCTACPSEIPSVYSCHFITPNVGVVGLVAHVAYTSNAGNTWTILNGGNVITGPPNGDILAVSGIFISQDQQRIVALSARNIFVSSNAGSTWSNVFQWLGGERGYGLHLTWTDDQNLWGFAKANQRVRSIDGGLTWSIISAYSGGGASQYAGHFYRVNEGFFSQDSNLLETFDGSVSGALSDSSLFLIQAVWTHLDEPICYQLTDCAGIQQPVIVSDDLSAYVDHTINWCSRTPYRYPLPDPPPCEPVDGCWSVSIAANCDNALAEGSVEVTFDYGIDACSTCLPTCYLLEDCEGVLSDIITDTDLNQYVGQIIRLNACPDDCWQVSIAPTCDNASAVGIVLASFATCLECNPLPIPEPLELKLRSVKPGYDTPGCSAEYTEKVNCNFAEAMYNEVVSLRYGIEICCDIDPQKWIIKKELLDLDVLYNPDLCKCLFEICECPTCVTGTLIVQNWE